jgi:hypothetical protein
MSDLFREIDEELRREKFERLWQRHGTLIVVLVVLALAAFGGWRYYMWQKASSAEASGVTFEQAISLSKAGKAKEADALFDKLAASGSGGYRILASFRSAADRAQSDKPGAVKAFDALAADANLPQVLRDLARIRAATLQVDSASYQDMASRVEGLASAGGAWRNSARELMGLVSYRTGELESAGKWFDQIVVDREAPPSQRQRAQLMLELVRGGPVPKS